MKVEEKRAREDRAPESESLVVARPPLAVRIGPFSAAVERRGAVAAVVLAAVAAVLAFAGLCRGTPGTRPARCSPRWPVTVTRPSWCRSGGCPG